MKAVNERDGGKIKRTKNVNLMQGQIQQQLNTTTQIGSGKGSNKFTSKIEDGPDDEFFDSERATDFQTQTTKEPE